MYSRNAEVDTANARELEQLPNSPCGVLTFEARDAAYPARDQPGDDERLQELFDNFRVAAVVRLKVNAQVMLLWNLDVDAGLVNGSRGVVVATEQWGDTFGRLKQERDAQQATFKQLERANPPDHIAIEEGLVP